MSALIEANDCFADGRQRRLRKPSFLEQHAQQLSEQMPVGRKEKQHDTHQHHHRRIPVTESRKQQVVHAKHDKQQQTDAIDPSPATRTVQQQHQQDQQCIEQVLPLNRNGNDQPVLQ